MAVKIGHASISESGTINGTKGDSTGEEVCIRDWYSKPWDFMAIHPDATVREKHAVAIEKACNNDNIGYGQADRNTLNTLAKNVGYDFSKVGKCNCDCSSLQNAAAVASGAPGVTYGSNGWTTSTMKKYLTAAGYKIITDPIYLASADYCVRGAIYVKSGTHTVAGLENGSKASQTLSKAGVSNTNESYVGKGIGSAIAKTTMNVRTSSSTSSSVVGTVSKSGTVEVLEILSNGWYKIVWSGVACGYAYTSNVNNKYYTFVKNGAESSGNTSLEPVAARSKNTSLKGTYTTTANLNMRAVPGVLDDDNIITVLPKGTKVQNYGYYTTVSGVKWLYVIYNGLTGYCSEEYLKK